MEKINQKRLLEVKPIPIPTRQAVPLLEAIVLEDESSIQVMWARLIANATNPSEPKTINKSFIKVLASIDPVEASILEALRPRLEAADPSAEGVQVDGADLGATLGLHNQELMVALHNLVSLGCLRSETAAVYLLGAESPVMPWQFISTAEANFYVTSLSVALLTACAPPASL